MAMAKCDQKIQWLANLPFYYQIFLFSIDLIFKEFIIKDFFFKDFIWKVLPRIIFKDFIPKHSRTI